MQLRLVSGESPRVVAATESSSPIFVSDTNNGISLYSKMASGFFNVRRLNRRMPRMRIAFPISRASSNTVGKKRIITAKGIVTLLGICIFDIPAMNSFTLVVVMT